MGRRIGVRQRWAWIAAATVCAVVACGCGISWVWVLLGGLPAAVGYVWLDRRLPACGLACLLRHMGGFGKTVTVLSLIWYVGVLAWCANLADYAFPMVDGYPLLGLMILALAAWGSWKGAAACGRCAAVLLLFLLPLLGTVTAFAAADVTPSYLLPAGSWRRTVEAAGVFLLPSCLFLLPCRRKRPGGSWRYLLLPVGGAVLAAVTAGVLSPVLAARMASPFYTVVKAVRVFGVMERVEALLSAAMVMSVFALTAALACGCRALAGKKWAGAAACGVAALLMAPSVGIGPEYLAAGGFAFGVLVPVLVVLMMKTKKHNE